MPLSRIRFGLSKWNPVLHGVEGHGKEAYSALSLCWDGRRSLAANAPSAVPSLLFEDLTVRKPTGEIPALPFVRNPFFDK